MRTVLPSRTSMRRTSGKGGSMPLPQGCTSTTTLGVGGERGDDLGRGILGLGHVEVGSGLLRGHAVAEQQHVVLAAGIDTEQFSPVAMGRSCPPCACRPSRPGGRAGPVELGQLVVPRAARRSRPEVGMDEAQHALAVNHGDGGRYGRRATAGRPVLRMAGEFRGGYRQQRRARRARARPPGRSNARRPVLLEMAHAENGGIRGCRRKV